jgi:hypothetical protein
MDYTRMKLSHKYFNHCDASYEEIEKERQRLVNDFISKANIWITK